MLRRCRLFSGSVRGIVLGGVVGDGRNGGALGQGQLADILVVQVVGAGLHAAGVADKAHRIEIGLKNRLLGIAAVERDGAKDLPHLAQRIVVVVAGDVLDQLLGNGGSALLGIVQLDLAAGQLAEHQVGGGRDRALEVDAVVLAESLVLHGDKGVFQIVGDLVAVHPDAVGVVHQALVGLRLAGLRVDGVDGGGIAELQVFKAEQRGVVCRHLDHIKAEHDRQHRGHDDPDADQHHQDAADVGPHPFGAAFLFRSLRGAALRACGARVRRAAAAAPRRGAAPGRRFPVLFVQKGSSPFVSSAVLSELCKFNGEALRAGGLSPGFYSIPQLSPPFPLFTDYKMKTAGAAARITGALFSHNRVVRGRSDPVQRPPGGAPCRCEKNGWSF